MSTDNNPQFPKIDKIEETKPVVWTPEDASRFLTSAIHEAQKPLADALKQRPVTAKGLTLIIGILVAAALAVALILSNQLEKTEKRAEAMQASREAMLSEKVNLEAQASTLEEKLGAAATESADLQTRIDTLRTAEDQHRRTQQDLARFKRQNELLRNQISGLEMEKVALARQLDAVRALSETEAEAEMEAAAAPAITKITVQPEPIPAAEPTVEPVAEPEPTIEASPAPEQAEVPQIEVQVEEPAETQIEVPEEQVETPVETATEPTETPEETPETAEETPESPAEEIVPEETPVESTPEPSTKTTPQEEPAEESSGEEESTPAV